MGNLKVDFAAIILLRCTSLQSIEHQQHSQLRSIIIILGEVFSRIHTNLSQEVITIFDIYHLWRDNMKREIRLFTENTSYSHQANPYDDGAPAKINESSRSRILEMSTLNPSFDGIERNLNLLIKKYEFIIKQYGNCTEQKCNLIFEIKTRILIGKVATVVSEYDYVIHDWELIKQILIQYFDDQKSEECLKTIKAHNFKAPALKIVIEETNFDKQYQMRRLSNSSPKINQFIITNFIECL